MPRKTKQNDITSAELLAQVNPDNKQLLLDFVDYLRSVQRSETTINGYINDIEIAFVWNLRSNKNKFFVEWTKRNIVSLQNWMIYDLENSPSRVRRVKAALSSMSNYIVNVLDDEFPNFKNIIMSVESPANQKVREKTVWKAEELESLLDTLIEKKEYQKACYLALGMYSGRRKSELCRFKMSDFGEDNLVLDGALYKSGLIKTKGRGGGKFIHCYTLAKKFTPYLNLWKEERERLGIDTEWLFPSIKDPNEHVKISTINSWARTFSRLANKPAYIHSLRSYFTTSLSKAGIPDGVIQAIVAWESSDMVQLYKDINAEDQIAMYFKDGDISAPKSKGLTDL